MLDENPISTDRQFTGHRLLEEAKVYHAGARFYNPQLGAFIQADKVEGPNRYMYVKANPISLNDPSGNVSCRSCINNIFNKKPNTRFPDEAEGINGVGSFFKANVAKLLSSIGIIRFMPPSSLDQYVSRNEVDSDFLLAMSPGGAMITAPKISIPRLFNFSQSSGRRMTRNYNSVMSEATDLFNTSPVIQTAQAGVMDLNRGNVNFDTYNTFIRDINRAGVRTAWDAPGAFAPNGRYHTEPGNLIRTMDDGTSRTLIMHPDIRRMLDTNPRAALDEAYFHGVHDFAAVQLGFHSPNHPHRGLATGFHYLDFLFNRSVGKDGVNQSIRFNQTRLREFGIPFGTRP